MRLAKLVQVMVVLALLAGAMAVADEARKGSVAKASDREKVFEFSEAPQVKKSADKWTVTFATKSACDVAVAVEHPDGRIVNFLGAGVLGTNAPEPFVKGSLKQTLVWDLKDTAGIPVPDAGRCVVRVSLGLMPRFSRTIVGHDKDFLAGGSVIEGIAADTNGVYVLSYGFGTSTLNMFDHNGHYVRTLVPFSAANLAGTQLKTYKGQVSGPDGSWTVPAVSFNNGVGQPYAFARYEFNASPSKLSAAGGVDILA